MVNTTEKVTFRFDIIDRASAKMKEIGDNVADIGKEGMKTKQEMALMGTAVLTTFGLIAKKSIDMASSFEKSMTNVSTLVDTSVESIDTMKQEVLDIADRTPVALEDLSSALYDVRSAGIASEDAMQTLEASAQLATAGLGTTKEATNLLTSSINAFSAQGYDADQIANTLFNTVKNGKTTVSELANGFGGISGLASTLGIDFQELMAATAALTTTGMSASNAYSGMKGALTNILKPTTVAGELAANLGIEMGAAAIESRGLAGRLEHMKDKLQDGNLSATEQTAAITDLFGSVEGLNAVLALTGSSSEAFNNTLDDMGVSTNALNEAFEKQKATFASQSAMLKNNINRLFIELGTIILPSLIAASKMLINTINSLRDRYEQLSPAMQKTIKIAAALVTGFVVLVSTVSVLSYAFSALTAAVGTSIAAVGLLFAPITLFVAAVAVRAYLIIKYRDDIAKAFDDAAKRIAVKMLEMRDAVINFQNETIRAIAEWIISTVSQFTDWVSQTRTQITNFGTNLVEGIGSAIVKAFNKIVSFKDQIRVAFAELAENTLQRGKNMMNMFVDGISSRISAVRDMVSSVAQEVKDYLGFSSPTKKGPGSNSDQWIPNLITMLGRGMLEGTTEIARSAAYLGSAIGAGVNGQSFSLGTSTMSQGTTTGPSIMTATGFAGGIGGGSRNVGGGISINISGNAFYGTGDEMVEMISDQIMNKVKTHMQTESF